jgi:CheY-like chemotaxis protein
MTNNKNSILVVDDEPSIQRALKRSFFDFPYSVFTASSGQEALELLENKSIDLILSDFKMPGMDGAEFLKRVKEKHPEIIRIMISGYIDKDKLMESLFHFNVVSLFPKPWQEETLHNEIQKCLALKESVKDAKLWTRLNSHNLSFMQNSSLEKHDSLHDYILCEPGIYSGLLHLYNSEYYNGGQQFDIDIIEKHFTSDTIRSLLHKSDGLNQKWSSDFFLQQNTRQMHTIHKCIREKLSGTCQIGQHLHPSLINLFRYITYICDEELFEKIHKEHFFINESGGGGYEFSPYFSAIFQYAIQFLTLWDLAEPLLSFSKRMVELGDKGNFGDLDTSDKVVLINDFYMEKYRDLPADEIVEKILKDSVLQKLQGYQ